MADSLCWTGLCYISLCMLVIVAGSALIYTAFYNTYSLRNNSNALFLSLVTSDLLTALTVFPGEIVGLWYHPNWPLGAPACRLWNTLFVIFTSLSVINLCFISLERLWALKRPFLYDSTALSRRLFMLIVIIWLFSLFCGIYSYFIWQVDLPLCQQLSAPLELSIPLLLVDILFPYLACIIAYGKIFRISHHHARNIITAQEAMDNRWTNGNRQNIRAYLLVRKSSFTVGLLVGSYTVCCFPFFIFHTVDGALDERLPARYVTGNAMKWMVFFSSSTNWALYGFLNRDFRRAILRILRKIKGGNTRATIDSLT